MPSPLCYRDCMEALCHLGERGEKLTTTNKSEINISKQQKNEITTTIKQGNKNVLFIARFFSHFA